MLVGVGGLRNLRKGVFWEWRWVGFYVIEVMNEGIKIENKYN